MDWNMLLDQLGGGVSAALIAGLAYAYWAERKANTELNAEMRQMLREVIPAVDALKAALVYVERQGR
jgi:uncharacterized membrane protein YfbV (UPF0208 family)